ncbi:PAS domain S-box-containing protein [Hydrogenispora ethanolica]|uniref:PAS domain S-box-containing protein n=1 Tax=Hydrogenispora ethanolica TaxID=1082276 RepID=A0A4R1QLQ8_HYDET|nr:sigma 54-interacting transcriptional regulator [Hydrogenispora ethanolica]TCL54137.1 PAS domain S-box-containing protein [Hydrogenispora ethanolica]
MAKIAFMAANQDMLEQAAAIAGNFDMEVEIKLITSADVVAEANLAVRNGADIVIARGTQAYLVRKYTQIPVVEIVLTGQELALLINEARKLTGKSHPVIGILGVKSMFSNTKPFEEILDLTIREYFVEKGEELEEAARRAWEDKVDILIGGKIAIECAQKWGLPTLFLKSQLDSIADAFRNAERMAYAIELEKTNTAELRTILNYSFDGIIRLDNQGCVTVVNYMAEKILGKSSDEMLGKPITDILKLPDEDQLRQVLVEGKSLYSIIINHDNLALVANLANMTVDNVSQGMILSFREFKKIEEMEAEIRKKLYTKGYVAEHTFNRLAGRSKAMKGLKSAANAYAKYDLPVLLSGELGTGKSAMAECIHNSSLRQQGPFVSVNCQGVPKEFLQKQLFGYAVENPYTNLSSKVVKGAFELAHTGTLFLDHVAELNDYCQTNLLRVLQQGTFLRLESEKAYPVNVRVICATDVNLTRLVKEGKFNEELYYELSVLELYLPPLRQRKEDIADLLDYYIQEYGNFYRKYIILTEDAREMITAYPWYGNVQQLKRFCEKLVILADKKVLDSELIDRSLASFTGSWDEDKFAAGEPAGKVIVYQNPESSLILKALEKHKGNRNLVAAELGISTTTLWRKIKKYHIKYKFDV